MSTLPALVAFKPPDFNLGETYTSLARLAAYDQARRTSALELEEKRGKLDREQLWRQTIAGALQPPDQVPGQGFTAPAPPQASPMPPGSVPGGGMPQVGATGQPGGFTATMAQQVPPATPEQGSYAQMAPGGGLPGMPSSYGTAPIDLQSRAGLEAMARSGDPTAPPQGGLTTAVPGTAPGPQQGLTAPQPSRPLAMSVPGLMPLPNAEAVQRAFAIDPEKTSQWYTAYLTQRAKHLDEVDRNNKLVYQVTGAMRDNPEYYQEGLDYLREQGVPVPKNMPPTYNAALVNFHHQLTQERMTPIDEEKVKTQRLINQLIPQAMQQMQPGGGGAPGSAGGGTGAAGGGAAPRPQTGLDQAVADATRLYPQVRPELVHGIIRHESNYDVGAVSPKGAVGPMQLMPGTAKDMGVDPKDAAENVRGGVRYFDQLLTKYGGNEQLALAAYNWGPANVDKVGGDLTKMPAETQAYVKNVLGTAASGQRGPAGTQGQVAGPGAPATSAATTPEVQRLDQQMAESQRKIDALKPLVLADPQRFNTALDNEQKTLDTLRKERDRLVPSPARIAEMEAGPRIAAASERATKEEIDAINRLRPEGQKISYGATRAEIREKGLVGAAEVPPAALNDLSDRSNIVQQLGQLTRRFGDLPTGPIVGRLQAYKQALGIDVKDEAVAYRTLLAQVQNALGHAIGGTNLTANEISRIQKALPTETDPPQTFKAKLQAAMDVAEQIYKTKAGLYRKAGYGVTDAMMSPWGEEGRPPTTTASTKEDLLQKHTR